VRTEVPEIAIIGAGVVGMACAAALAGAGRSVVVLERHARPGHETTSRNSEVIHAGIYYPPESLKARSCVEGRELLYERCSRLGIPHRRIGKLIVACDPGEIEALERLRDQAAAAGAGPLELLDARQVTALEPRVRAAAGLFSPSTGIIDAHALLDSYQAELEAAGGQLVLHTEITGLQAGPGGWRIDTRTAHGEPFLLEVGAVVNAAGLEADRIAALAGVDVEAKGWRIHPCKGDYFSAAPSLGRLTEHLVYPVPSGAGLGIHVTLDLAGSYRFGPDATYVEAPHYAVDPGKAADFARAIRRYLPEVSPADLAPAWAGVRPKLSGPGEPFRDFVLAEGSEQGAPGLVSLVGIESPGLTAAGALARHVVSLL
jgi:L-2-hydroxyglutarate oxidase LhgO